MTSKIEVPKNVADALEDVTRHNGCDEVYDMVKDIVDGEGTTWHAVHTIARHFEHSMNELMQALVNGWEVEVHPHDRIRAMHNFEYQRSLDENYQESVEGGAKVEAIEDVLDILGITIEGVND